MTATEVAVEPTRSLDVPARTLVRFDGVATAVCGVVAVGLGYAVGGAALVVLGLDALVISGLRRGLFERAVPVFGLAREAVLLAVLVSGIRDGFGAPDVVVGALLAEAVVLGVLESRAVRRPT